MSNLDFLNNSGFDADEIDDFGALPAGDYEVDICDSEMRDNKKGNGRHLYVEHNVTEGARAGAKLFNRFNLAHDVEDTVERAQRQFANLCRACGVVKPIASSELHNIPIIAVVEVDGEYNRIKRYKAVAGNAVTTEKPKRSPYEKASPDVGDGQNNDFDADVKEDELSDNLPF